MLQHLCVRLHVLRGLPVHDQLLVLFGRELWRGLLGPANEKIVLAAGHEGNIRSYCPPDDIYATAVRVNDLESVRGFTAAHLDRGADQIYSITLAD